MKFSHNQPHGLSIEERDKLAKQRQLFPLAILPNTDGYEFYGYADDGWRFNSAIKKGADGIHRIIGEASYSQLIGWLPLQAPKRCDTAACNCEGLHDAKTNAPIVLPFRPCKQCDNEPLGTDKCLRCTKY